MCIRDSLIPGILAIPVVVWLGNPYATLISLFFLTIYAAHEVSLRYNLRWNVPIASHTFKVMARKEELEGKYFTGSVYFWVCTTIIVALMEPTRAAAAVMVSSFGDAAAAILDKALAGPMLPYNPRKTIAGSFAMLVTSILSCMTA